MQRLGSQKYSVGVRPAKVIDECVVAWQSYTRLQGITVSNLSCPTPLLSATSLASLRAKHRLPELFVAGQYNFGMHVEISKLSLLKSSPWCPFRHSYRQEFTGVFLSLYVLFGRWYHYRNYNNSSSVNHSEWGRLHHECDVIIEALNHATPCLSNCPPPRYLKRYPSWLSLMDRTSPFESVVTHTVASKICTESIRFEPEVCICNGIQGRICILVSIMRDCLQTFPQICLCNGNHFFWQHTSVSVIGINCPQINICLYLFWMLR